MNWIKLAAELYVAQFVIKTVLGTLALVFLFGAAIHGAAKQKREG